MLNDIINKDGKTEEVKIHKFSDVSGSMTDAQRNDDRKLYSLKDFYDAFAGASATTVTQPTPAVTQPTPVVRG